MGRGVFFGWGASFLSGEGGAPWGASVLMWRVFEKNCKMGGGGCAGPPPLALWKTLLHIDIFLIFRLHEDFLFLFWLKNQVFKYFTDIHYQTCLKNFRLKLLLETKAKFSLVPWNAILQFKKVWSLSLVMNISYTKETFTLKMKKKITRRLKTIIFKDQ